MDDETLLKVGSVLNQRCNSGDPNLLQEELDYVLIWELNAQINEGTFENYLANQSGDRVAQVMDALERLGSIELIGILKEAVSLLPGGWCYDQNERRIRVAAVPNGSAHFRALTEDYYRALESEDSVSFNMMLRIHDAYKRHGII